jgi:hypothetical protein
MAKPRNSRRIRKPRVDEAVKLGKTIGVPVEQLANQRFEKCDVVNHTDDDHRAMVRSLGAQMLNPDARHTIKRKAKLDTLPIRKLLDQRELRACVWYQEAHEELYGSRVRIVDWEGGSRCTDKAFGHWPAGMPLEPGENIFQFARRGINRFLIAMFEAVVLHGRPVGRLRNSFKMAACQLADHIEGTVEL